MGLLSRWFSRAGSEAAAADASTGFEIVPLKLKDGTTLPIVDWWPMVDECQVPEADAHRYWTNVAYSWLVKLRDALNDGYTIVSSKNFLLLSRLSGPERTNALASAESSLRRTLRVLDGIATNDGNGLHVFIAFDTAEAYYHYVQNYYEDDHDFGASVGMFLDDGYGHFVLVGQSLDRMEDTIVHELTHALVRHLPIPAWLNEGLAQNTELALIPHLRDPRNALYSPREMAAKHLAFWNADTMQEYWSGKSFTRPDDGQLLSYELARHMTAMLSKDYDAFCRFVKAAHGDDSGYAAASEHLGVALEEVAAAVTGAGPWAPDPKRWKEGIEAGAF